MAVNRKSNTVFTASTSYYQLHSEDEEEDTLAYAVDYKHMPAVRSKTGRWRSAAFIIGVEMAERIAFYGIQGNLINYLTGELGQSTASAAAGVNAWAGVAALLPVLGAVVADSFLGKYSTVIAASLLYILGLGLLTLSATLPSHTCLTFERGDESTHGCPTHLQTVIFFGALYLVALGQGGHKPCVQAFGADQFDADNPAENKAKSSFFNWWYFGLSLGALIGVGGLSYVQDNLSWGLGFGIPCIIMVIALLLFIFGTFMYRFMKKREGDQSPFIRIGRVFARAARNRHATDETQSFRCLEKAMLAPDVSRDEVEEAKALLRLFPIWATSLIYGVIFAQTSTFFTKQGATLDRSIGPTFKIPPAALQSCLGIVIITFIPIYDRLLVPLAKRFTGQPAGISVLQRIGAGLFISIVCMVVAAIIERQRLNISSSHGLIDLPNATLPMSIWWLIPQYALFGISEVFTIVGLQEFFYGQVPAELRSVGMSLYLSVLGIGSFLSSFLVSLIDQLTGDNGEEPSWLSDNLNRAHLDYFYWLLAALSAIALVLFLCFSRSYVYNNTKIVAY